MSELKIRGREDGMEKLVGRNGSSCRRKEQRVVEKP